MCNKSPEKNSLSHKGWQKRAAYLRKEFGMEQPFGRFPSRHVDLSQKSSGVTNNIKDGSVLFKCSSKPWQWASMHNTKSLKLNQLHGIKAPFILIFTPVLLLLWLIKMSTVEKVYFSLETQTLEKPGIELERSLRHSGWHKRQFTVIRPTWSQDQASVSGNQQAPETCNNNRLESTVLSIRAGS